MVNKVQFTKEVYKGGGTQQHTVCFPASPQSWAKSEPSTPVYRAQQHHSSLGRCQTVGE